MVFEYVWKGLLVIAILSVAGVVLVQVGLVSVPWGPDDGEVRVFGDDSDGESTTEPHDGTGNETTAASDDSTDETDGTDGNEREPKAVVDVEVADDRAERITGLSNHDSLERGTGMLFIHSSEDEQTYVMREMDFDIDIIFIGADREITTIHHARAPGPDENGNDLQYSGRGKWVLELPRGYTNETGIEVGDEVEIDLESNRTVITGSESDSLERFAATADRDVVAPEAAAAGTYFDS
ncbi:DUF192 domain-containing protein [Natrinema longum]|uniref:DUF192 domain-containing protein n=1 Tax=Natrinema longum TaxID=370324 RepID=A0A8A2U8F8_9EURY|nr:DUF192 domain-containing protein [Natrinema longum]MBZ6493669.1 DUF192 domain-containing protein [Natrinema longum]QSW84990.1 DUF192 domain-containing protein [Natrinema longum]